MREAVSVCINEVEEEMDERESERVRERGELLTDLSVSNTIIIHAYFSDRGEKGKIGAFLSINE